jgi:hypothetical protein
MSKDENMDSVQLINNICNSNFLTMENIDLRTDVINKTVMKIKVSQLEDFFERSSQQSQKSQQSPKQSSQNENLSDNESPESDNESSSVIEDDSIPVSNITIPSDVYKSHNTTSATNTMSNTSQNHSRIYNSTQMRKPIELRSDIKKYKQSSEHQSETLSEYRSEQLSEHQSKQLSEYQSEQLSEHQSKQLSEHQSKQLSEHQSKQLSGNKTEQLSAQFQSERKMPKLKLMSPTKSQNSANRIMKSPIEKPTLDIFNKN